MRSKPQNIQPVKVGQAGFLLERTDGVQATVPFISGAIHYYHLPQKIWKKCLDAAVDFGLPMVETYIPWAVHERSFGVFDFEQGDGKYERDLGTFLKECSDRKLKVLVRPGPHINGELTGFGFPSRIFKDKRYLAVGARGNSVFLTIPPHAFPVPSYASNYFLEEVTAWLTAVGNFLSPFCWPNGPIIATQVDNEFSFFFRTAAYDQDYHPDAISLYRKFLADKYGGDLPVSYGTTCDLVEPPRQMDANSREDLVKHLDWVRFKEWLVVKSLSEMGQVLKGAGLDGIVQTHNFPGTHLGESCSLAKTETIVDIAGFDIYLRNRDYKVVKRLASLLAGCCRLPILPELACGSWPWWFPQSSEDQLSVALTALMHGVKGFNLYMFVDRDRWFCAPITKDGTPSSNWYERKHKLVQAVKQFQIPNLHRKVEVAVMEVRDYRQLALCTSLVDPIPPMALSVFGIGAMEVCSDETYGFDGPIQLEQACFVKAAETALEMLQIPFHIVDSDLAADRLACFRVLVVPLFDFIDIELLERLHIFVEGGGLLVLGPRQPTLDARMMPLDKELPEHIFCEEHDLEPVLEDLIDGLITANDVVATEREIEIATYKNEKRIVVIFAANQSERSCVCAIRGAALEGLSIRDSITGDPVNLDSVHFQARQVRMLCCEEILTPSEEEDFT